jgi:hypothetical protein
LCLKIECTILGYSSCENGFVPTAFIVHHCTKNDVWESFGAFRNLSECKRCKTCVSGVNALFRGTEVAKMISHQMHHFYSIRPKMMFGCVLKHFRTVWNVKDATLVFRVCIFKVPEL